MENFFLLPIGSLIAKIRFMDTEILKDPIYRQFYAALTLMLKTEWKKKQTVLGELSGISKGYMVDIVKGKKKPSFPKRHAIATTCGESYEEFLNIGEKILGSDTENFNILQFKSDIEKAHFEIIIKFLNKKKAKKFNEYLVDIERFDEEVFEDLYREVKATHKALSRLNKKKEDSQKAASGE